MPTLSSQKLDPPLSNSGSNIGEDKIATNRGYAMSPSQGRLSPERTDRPSSPTKGLGGFVQSAMMKRSDSVSKRWSTQNTPGLSRGNSIAGGRTGVEAPKFPLGGMNSLGEVKPTRFSRDNTPALTSSRPTSSHSDSTANPSQSNVDGPDTTTSSSFRSSTPPKSPPLKITPPLGAPAASPSKDAQDEAIMSPPTSPSKRWSPQKSSWLENALNKPDSPKLISPVTSTQQPSWMVDINRAKQQRGSVDLSKGPLHKQISTGGLMRSPPPGTGFKPPNIGGLTSGASAQTAMRPRSGSSSDHSKANDSPAPVGLPPSKSLSQISVAPPAKLLDRSDTLSSPLAKPPLSSPENTSPKAVGSKPRPSDVPLSRPKPDTPPKKDFKSTLKSRPKPDEAYKKAEPEFKNVFGNLKRTQTQNYKAPDELKDNVMRGKAGLAVTGGPKKTERKDEFKESILKKKQGMVAPSASTRITSASSKHPEPSIPEAIAKRQGLTRSGSSAAEIAPKPTKQDDSQDSEALANFRQSKDKSKPTALDKAIVEPKVQEEDNASLDGNFASSLAGILQRRPSPLSVPAKPSIISTETSNICPQPNDRSPPCDSQAIPQLTHATKGRARGPKRKLPTASRTDGILSGIRSESAEGLSKRTPGSEALSINNRDKFQIAPAPLSKPEPRPLSNITNSNNNNHKPALPASPRKPSGSVKKGDESSPTVSKPQPSQGSTKPVPAVKTKPASTLIEKTQTPSMLKAEVSATPLSKQTSVIGGQQQPFADSAFPLEGNREGEQEQSVQGPSVKGAAALWSQSSRPQSASPRSPIKLPTRQDENATTQGNGLIMKNSVLLDPNTASKVPLSFSPKPLAASPVLRSPKSPPLPGKKPASATDKLISSNLRSSSIPATSMSPSDSDAARLFADIFDEPPSPKNALNIKTSAALGSRSSIDTFPKIKTLRKQIVEIVANGKTIPVPSHQEHILFEDSLYVCTHVFGTPSGQRMTEVYLWCGDGASSSSADDAQLFAKKVAKDANGRLIMLHQGKETSSFFQALGGIVIIRRGSNSQAGSSSGLAAAYMLCGRQHLGQIAFDEVDFSARNLCTGFPYIISTPSGKLHLWKGKGAGADELGCARLIGMDLGLTGEIEEVDEEQESKEFWSVFSTGDDPRPRLAQYWHLKPSCEKYMTRLYQVETEQSRPKSASSFMQWGRRGSAPAQDSSVSVTAQIREIVPFSHADVVDDSIFVLDAFFEIFVYVSNPFSPLS